MKTTISSYKGHPTISLDADSRYPFTFGVAKAELILANLDAIRAFVAQRRQPAGPDRFDMAVEDANAARCGLNGGAR